MAEKIPGSDAPGDGASTKDSPTVKYCGLRTEKGPQVVRTHENNKVSPLPPRFDLWCYTAVGFNWPGRTDRATQLALAILADAVGRDPAMLLHRAFMLTVVSRLKRKSWELTRDEVVAWVAKQ